MYISNFSPTSFVKRFNWFVLKIRLKWTNRMSLCRSAQTEKERESCRKREHHARGVVVKAVVPLRPDTHQNLFLHIIFNEIHRTYPSVTLYNTAWNGGFLHGGFNGSLASIKRFSPPWRTLARTEPDSGAVLTGGYPIPVIFWLRKEHSGVRIWQEIWRKVGGLLAWWRTLFSLTIISTTPITSPGPWTKRRWRNAGNSWIRWVAINQNTKERYQRETM